MNGTRNKAAVVLGISCSNFQQLTSFSKMECPEHVKVNLEVSGNN